MNAVRKARACKECHDGHRKVISPLIDCDHQAAVLADANQCPHVVPQANSGASQEPSPASDAGPVTPASAGQGVDFILFDSSEDSGMDTPDDLMDADMDIDTIAQVSLRLI